MMSFEKILWKNGGNGMDNNMATLFAYLLYCLKNYVVLMMKNLLYLLVNNLLYLLYYLLVL
jgi:hypothetical protein